MEYHNPTLRVLRILELIDSNPNGLNLSEIADLLELPKGTISPILKTLSAKKYVDLEGMLYKIGPRLFQLGLSFASGTNALSLIRKEMHNIVAAVEEVCQMGVLSGTDVHYLLREDAKTVITIISGVGKRLPAHVTGLGKALLSGKTDEEVRDIYRDYSFVPYTQKSIMDVEKLVAQLQQVRVSGIAYENEESTPDICCIAVPLMADNSVKAAISVTIPKFRYNEQQQQQITALLLQKKRLIEENCRIQNYHLDF